MQPRISAVLLAAGSSTRMGRTKQLLPLGDRPLIRHGLDAIIAAGVREIVAVLGRNREGIEGAIAGLPVKAVINELPESEMAESVRTGLRALGPSSSGILVCPSDHPLVSAETLRTLMCSYVENPDKIVVPVYNNRKGHPCLFPRDLLNEIFAGNNLRAIIKKHPEKVMLINVNDDGVVLDIDTAEDYEKILKRF